MKKQAKNHRDETPPPPEATVYEALPTGPTGRSLIVLNPNSQKSLMRSLKDTAGLNVATSSDFEGGAVTDDQLGGADALLLENLNIAVVDADDEQVQSLTTAILDEANPVLSVEPEEYVQAFEEEDGEGAAPGEKLMTEDGRRYLQGYSDGVAGLVQRLLGEAGSAQPDEFEVAATFADTAALTWGLQAVRADRSLYSGSGIRIAVLDTGMDLRHPDFFGRAMLTASFVPGEAVQDGHSHGTHCIGTACGPKSPAGNVRRYGVAHQAVILAGKVLNNAGSGTDGWILAGINWAIQNRAAIISMSLGAPVAVGGTFKQAYEQARASFSCLGLNPNGGEVNIAAPGVAVYSSVPMPTRYGFKSGTSMATPHVAGVAALWAQSSGLRGTALWKKLTGTALNIGQSASAVGAGLSLAPTSKLVIQPNLPLRPPFRLPRLFNQPAETNEVLTS
jgi:subtilisin family serine protease